jgi:hypothetical protein
MKPRSRPLAALAALLLAIAACTLPGATSPTPFTFPTPNLTLTAIFAPTVTPTPEVPTLPPIEPTATTAPSATAGVFVPTSTSTISSLTVRPNGSPVTAAYLTAPPTIDGSLNDWSSASYSASQLVFGASNWSGAADLGASYYIGWDTTNLYLGVKVTDDKLVQVSHGASIFKGDDVELQLDTALALDFFSTSLSVDDFQIGMSPGNFDSLPPEAYRWYPVSQAGSLSSVVVKAQKATGGYVLEAKIPWLIFGMTLKGGEHLGFALSVSDDDLSGKAIQQSMVSSVSTRNLVNPTTWGTLILESPAGK